MLHNAVGMHLDRTSPARHSKRRCKWTTTFLFLSFPFHLAGAQSEGLLRRSVVMGTLFAFPSERFQSCCRWTGIQTLHWAQISLQKQLSICGHSLRDIMGVFLSKVKQNEMEQSKTPTRTKSLCHNYFETTCCPSDWCCMIKQMTWKWPRASGMLRFIVHMARSSILCGITGLYWSRLALSDRPRSHKEPFHSDLDWAPPWAPQQPVERNPLQSASSEW